MSHLLKCGVLAIACLLPVSAWVQSTPDDAAKAGEASKTTEPAMKIDSATKGTTGDAAPASSNKMAPGSQGAGNGADSGAKATAAPAASNKMNGDTEPAK